MRSGLITEVQSEKTYRQERQAFPRCKGGLGVPIVLDWSDAELILLGQ